MAARIFSLRRRRLISASISPFSQLIQSPHTHSQIPIHTPSSLNASIQSPLYEISHRSFSWWGYSRKPEPNAIHTFEEEREEEEHEFEASTPESKTDVQHTGSSFDSVGNGVENGIALEGASNGAGWYNPVDGAIALLDGLHNITGLPWWLTIAASAVTIRLATLPVLILQYKKMHIISQILRKLPPPLPTSGSRRSLQQQFTLFMKQKRAMACPTFLWFYASFAAQVPCFICAMTAVRRMCFEDHPGFDSGGASWFVDLTNCVYGPMGALFPISIAAMHFLNVQISFKELKHVQLSGIMAGFSKYYKFFMEFLTMPIFVIAFNCPQGLLVYWLSNYVWSATEKLTLKHPSIRQKLGLHVHPRDPEPVKAVSELVNGKSIDQLSSDKLLVLAAQHVAEGHADRALPLLRTVVEKEPEKSEAYIALGRIQLMQRLWAEAGKHFELAITKGKNDDVLISAYVHAVIALINQGKKVEAMAHLRKLETFEEPKDPHSRFRYYEGLTILASLLLHEGNKVEAAKYFQLVAKYDPSVNICLQDIKEP